jgi:hypothetical protein
MSRCRADVPSVFEHLCVLHVTVAQAIRRLELNKQTDRLTEVIVGCLASSWRKLTFP